MDDRCTGACCRNFSIPYSPFELREAYDAWRAQTPQKTPYLDDIWLIAPMVRLVRTAAAEGGPMRYFYRCVHIDDATGNCQIYGIRPRMCREYPYGGQCTFTDCSWKSCVSETKPYELTSEDPPAQ